MFPRNYNLRRLNMAVRSRLGLPSPWVERTLVGQRLVVRGGTFAEPPVPDYDDAWIYACAGHAEVAFDVGANVGQSTLLMLQSSTVRRVVLIDANWEALAVAAENLIRNQLSAQCQFVRAFASDRGDTTTGFWTVGVGAAGSMYRGHAETAAQARAVTTVPTTTLDELCDLYGVIPDLVKIDVEGAEHKVLVGGTRSASQLRTRYLVEMHSPPELPMAKNAELVLAWAATAGYAAWYLGKGVRLETPEPIAHRGRCHVLLQPASWPYPEWLVGIEQSAALPAS